MGLMEKIFGDLNTKEVKKLEKIAKLVEKLAPVLTFPGENEMESLAECARRVLEGGRLMRYGDPT